MVAFPALLFALKRLYVKHAFVLRRSGIPFTYTVNIRVSARLSEKHVELFFTRAKFR